MWICLPLNYYHVIKIWPADVSIMMRDKDNEVAAKLPRLAGSPNLVYSVLFVFNNLLKKLTCIFPFSPQSGTIILMTALLRVAHKIRIKRDKLTFS